MRLPEVARPRDGVALRPECLRQQLPIHSVPGVKSESRKQTNG